MAYTQNQYDVVYEHYAAQQADRIAEYLTNQAIPTTEEDVYKIAQSCRRRFNGDIASLETAGQFDKAAQIRLIRDQRFPKKSRRKASPMDAIMAQLMATLDTTPTPPGDSDSSDSSEDAPGDTPDDQQ